MGLDANSKAAIVVILFLSVLEITFSCLCQPSHPQEQICHNNTFVALLKVRTEEFVYADDKKPTTTDIQKLDDIKNNILKNVDNEVGSDKQVTFRPVPTKREVVVQSLNHFPYDDYITSRIRYRVKIYEAYKGIDAEKLRGKSVYMYTAPDEGLCGKNLDPKRTYIVIGRIDDDGRLTVGLCDHVIEWDSIDIKQKRNVRRNMRDAPTACRANCEVEMCGWNDCRQSKPNVCMWTPEMSKKMKKMDILSANFLCVSTKEFGGKPNTCAWRKVPIDKKKRKRRRRHHEFLARNMDLIKAHQSKGLFP